MAASSSSPSDSTSSSSSFPYDLLLHRLHQHVKNQPNKIAVGWLSPNQNNGAATLKLETTLTYQELWNQTHQLAQRLQSITSLSKGDRIILVYPPSLQFMIAFLACCQAGYIAVPVFPPHPARRDTWAMFTNICHECGATVALTNRDYQHLKQLSHIQNAIQLLRWNNHNKTTNRTAKWPDQLQWIVTDDGSTYKASTTSTTTTTPTLLLPSDVAFLQYTSGSTSDPKGVMITHGNLAHNLTMITTELEAHADDTIVVSWLPQYHDMGLIGSYLGILYCGGTGYYMSPLTFLQRPMHWMEAVSQYHATHLQGPNFSFKLVARKFQPHEYYYSTTNSSNSIHDDKSSSSSQKRLLDLSSVRHVINAAEPVDEESMDSFARAFGPFGYRPHVMYPTYGLAEHTVFVCSGGQQRLRVNKKQLEVHGNVVVIVVDVEGEDNGKDTPGQDHQADHDEDTAITKLVGCGYPSRQGRVDVRIVHVDTLHELPPEKVGEIWIHSASKAAGYFGKPDETQADFHAPLEYPLQVDNDTEDQQDSPATPPLIPVSTDGYLRTGDLGFFHNNELFICGRLKDLIIIGGRNYYPQDLEATAEAAAADQCRPGCSAAFSIVVDPNNQQGEASGEEEICLVMELQEAVILSKNNTSKDAATAAYAALAETIRSSINQEHSLSLSVLVLLKPKTVPKTSSGKIARAWCRKAFVGKTLNAVYQKSFKHQVGVLEIENGATTSSQRPTTNTTTLTSTQVEKLRHMDKKDLLQRLVTDIATLGSLQADMISPNVAVATILDSLSLSQFKGLLQSNYAVQTLSDEYLFRESTTLTKLVEVVRLGYAPDDTNDAGAAPANASGVVASSSGGIAGAMGCPPGVVCCTIL